MFSPMALLSYRNTAVLVEVPQWDISTSNKSVTDLTAGRRRGHFKPNIPISTPNTER